MALEEVRLGRHDVVEEALAQEALEDFETAPDAHASRRPRSATHDHGGTHQMRVYETAPLSSTVTVPRAWSSALQNELSSGLAVTSPPSLPNMNRTDASWYVLPPSECRGPFFLMAFKTHLGDYSESTLRDPVPVHGYFKKKSTKCKT